MVDNTPPFYSGLTQTSSTPEYNESNTVCVSIFEPIDASNVDTILLYYRVNNGSWVEIDVSSTQNYTFTADILLYGQFYEWYFWFNDTAGNNNKTSIHSFAVVDNYMPTIIHPTSLTTSFTTSLHTNSTITTNPPTLISQSSETKSPKLTPGFMFKFSIFGILLALGSRKWKNNRK